MSTLDGTPDLLDRIRADWARERPDLDTAAMGVVGRIINMGGRLKGSAGQALKPYGLHYSDLDVLATLRRSGVPYQLTPTELMQSVLLTSGAMTASLTRLTNKTLVVRCPDERDGRVSSVVLTHKGIALIDEAISVRFAEAQSAIEGLTAAERDMLASLLRKMAMTGV